VGHGEQAGVTQAGNSRRVEPVEHRGVIQGVDGGVERLVAVSPICLQGRGRHVRRTQRDQVSFDELT